MFGLYTHVADVGRQAGWFAAALLSAVALKVDVKEPPDELQGGSRPQPVKRTVPLQNKED